MRETFESVASDLFAAATGSERLTLHLTGERTTFSRLNRGAVRQTGDVQLAQVTLRLIDDGRHACFTFQLTGEDDAKRGIDGLKQLRETLPLLPEDPYLALPETRRDTELSATSDLDGIAIADTLLGAADGLDLVGILASGPIVSGFADSAGQRNWFERSSFNLDWSLHLEGKATKTCMGGFDFDADDVVRSVESARAELGLLARETRTLEPGHYRVAFQPAAVRDILSLVSMGGFGHAGHTKGYSSLRRIAEEPLHPSVSIAEVAAEGAGPDFDAWGFVKPDRIALIREGRMADTLVSPRSAKEFGAVCTGAALWEMPDAVQMNGGDIDDDDVLATLGTGLLVGNLHYLNFSDQGACRFTGMTRFATFWVEDGEIVAPIPAMRFDDDVFRVLGTQLVGLTKTRRMFLNPRTMWLGRLTQSFVVPGAIVDDFRLTL